MNESMFDRLARLDELIADGRIIRGHWLGRDKAGRETSCLLAALAPECVVSGNPSACPAEMMPGWLARLTVWITDKGSAEAWPTVLQRYATLAHRWHALDASAWQRADYATRAAAIAEALQCTGDPKMVAAAARVHDLCTAVARGGAADKSAFAHASKVARKITEWTAVSCRTVADPGRAARAVDAIVGDVAAYAVGPEAEAAEATLVVAEAAMRATTRSVEWSASDTAAEATADRITSACLDAIEAECSRAESMSP